MRFMHTSDLHLGRRLNGYVLEDEQRYMLDQLLEMAANAKVEALVIAGDIFDTATPPEWAVRLWDSFIARAAERGLPLLVVSGNHDSGVRLSCGSALMSHTRVWIVGKLGESFGPNGQPDSKNLTASAMPAYVELAGVRFWLFPFVRPSDVRAWAKNLSAQSADTSNSSEASAGEEPADISTYTDAMAYLCKQAQSLPTFADMPNVCIAHQFVVGSAGGPTTSDSERAVLGTLDNVDSWVFEAFDYTALGHIHKHQKMGSARIRYSGTPLKYSTSEVHDNKAIYVVELKPGEPFESRMTVEEISWVPLHDFREVEGTLAELENLAEQESESQREDFIFAVVTEPDPLDARERLRRLWPRIASIRFAAKQLATPDLAETTLDEAQLADKHTLFKTFFESVAKRELSEAEQRVVDEALEQIVMGGE